MKLLTKNTSQGEKKNKNRRAIWALAMGLFIIVVALFVVLPIVKSKSPKASHGLVAAAVECGGQSAVVWMRLDKHQTVKTYGVDGHSLGALSLTGKDVGQAVEDFALACHQSGVLDGATVTVFAATGKAETESALRESAYVGAQNAAQQSGTAATVQKYQDDNAKEEAKRLKITLGKYVIITEILQYDASKSVRTLATTGMDKLLDELHALRSEK